MPSPLPPRRNRRAAAIALAVAGLSCADPSAPRPPQVPGLQAVSSRELTDSAGHDRPVRIEVVLADEDLQPIAGARIFWTFPASLSGTLSTNPADEHFLELPTTDANGRFVLYFRIGCGVGEGWWHFRAQIPFAPANSSWTDSLRIIALPGLADSIRMPRDTAVYQGNMLALRTQVTDKCGHPLPDVATLEALSGGIAVDGPTLTATAGPSRQLIRATAGTAVDSTYVSIVPEGEISVKLHHIGSVFPDKSWTWARLSLDGSTFAPLVTAFSGLESDLTAEWLPGGNAVTFRNGDAITRMDLSGTFDTIVAPLGPGLRMHCPMPSADGTGLYVHVSDLSGMLRTQLRRVALVSADSNVALTPMTTGRADLCPSPSPDGGAVVYSSIDGAVAGPTAYGLRYVNTQTLASEGTGMTARVAPRWSPDGTMIAATGSGTLYVVTQPDRVRRELATASYAEFLSWSPDSEWIIVERDGPVLELVNAQTGLRLPLGFTGYMRYPSWRK